MSLISKAGVVDGQIVFAEHLTRVIDALSAITSSDINVWGNFHVTGSQASFYSNTVKFYGGSVFLTSSTYVSASQEDSASFVLGINSSGQVVLKATSSLTNPISPGGNNQAIQFNSASLLSGSDNFRFDYSNNLLALSSSTFEILNNTKKLFQGTTTIQDSTSSAFSIYNNSTSSRNILEVGNTNTGSSSIGYISLTNNSIVGTIGLTSRTYSNSRMLSSSIFITNNTTGSIYLSPFDANYSRPSFELDWRGNLYLSSSLIVTGSIIGNTISSSRFSGSFSGSFFGDGGGLTGIAASKWTGSSNISRFGDVNITGTLFVSNSFQITGSLFLLGNSNFTGSTFIFTGPITASRISASIGITGSLLGTSSWSITASHVVTSSHALTSSYVNPLRQTVILTGSLFISASNTASALELYSSGTVNPVFSVVGSQGQLFSVTDQLSGSLFSVNDISGLPIMEAFSDYTVLIGNYQAPALYTTKRIISVTGSNNIYSEIPTSSYDGIWVDYTIKSESNARVGQIMAIWSGSSVNYVETSASVFGDTSGFQFKTQISGSNISITGSATSASWIVKTIIRSI